VPRQSTEERERTAAAAAEEVEIDSGRIEHLADGGISIPLLRRGPDGQVYTRERLIVQKRMQAQALPVDGDLRREELLIEEEPPPPASVAREEEEPANAIGPSSAEAPAPVRTRDRGLRVTADAIAGIAALAAREVPGVGWRPLGTVAGQPVAVGKEDRRGVRARIRQGTAEVDLSVTALYGACLPDVAAAVRDVVWQRIEEGTGLPVRRVTVQVSEIAYSGAVPPAVNGKRRG
jgi:uncharacterized alkaline shock family protein YloU